jgi:phage terminase large subunit-like protein
VAEVAYDPAYLQRSAEVLVDAGLAMVEFPQSAARMVPACQTAYEWICAGRVIHDGSSGLTDQLLSAVPRQTDNGWRLSKGRSKRKIDAAVALVMALERATGKVEETPHCPIWAFMA